MLEQFPPTLEDETTPRPTMNWQVVQGICAGGKDNLWCYDDKDEKRPNYKACSGKQEGVECSFDSDGYTRIGKCATQPEGSLLICDSDSGPGAPSNPPEGQGEHALNACNKETTKTVGSECWYQVDGNEEGKTVKGFCVGNKAKKLWCYIPAWEKRPSQMACIGKKVDDASQELIKGDATNLASLMSMLCREPEILKTCSRN